MKITESKTTKTAKGIIFIAAKYARKRNALDWFVFYNASGKMVYGSTKDFQTKENFLVKKCGVKRSEVEFYLNDVFVDKNYTGSEMKDLCSNVWV